MSKIKQQQIEEALVCFRVYNQYGKLFKEKSIVNITNLDTKKVQKAFISAGGYAETVLPFGRYSVTQEYEPEIEKMLVKSIPILIEVNSSKKKRVALENIKLKESGDFSKKNKGEFQVVHKSNVFHARKELEEKGVKVKDYSIHEYAGKQIPELVMLSI